MILTKFEHKFSRAVNCNFTLTFMKMAVQRAFDVNMSQSTSLLNVTRWFQKHTHTKYFLDFLGKPSGAQFLINFLDVRQCYIVRNVLDYTLLQG